MARGGKHETLYDFALLGLLAAIWGSSYLLVKVALATIPPITLIAARVTIAAVFLVIVMQYQGSRWPRDWSMWRLLFVQALFNSIASWTLLAWGQQFVDSGVAGVLNSTSPIFVLAFTWLVTRHEPITAWKVGGALMGLAGVGLIVGPEALRGLGKQTLGQLAILGSAALYACAAIHGRRFSALVPTVTAAGTTLWATLCLVPLALVAEQPWTLHPSAVSIMAAAALGLVCTGLALLVYFRLVHTIGSLGVASQCYLRAGVSVLLGVFVLGERLTSTAAFGLLGVILGVVMISARWSLREPTPPPATPPDTSPDWRLRTPAMSASPLAATPPDCVVPAKAGTQRLWKSLDSGSCPPCGRVRNDVELCNEFAIQHTAATVSPS
jgi:drug/metabolite transporter (DMT)-like permease